MEDKKILSDAELEEVSGGWSVGETYVRRCLYCLKKQPCTITSIYNGINGLQINMKCQVCHKGFSTDNPE